MDREDASRTQQALTKANMEPLTHFSIGPTTYFGFNVAENSTGEERYEIEDIVKVLNLEGIPHAIAPASVFASAPMTLDVGDKNLDARMED